jgi:asparagine synthase (glutamine-hydrolysing)
MSFLVRLSDQHSSADRGDPASYAADREQVGCSGFVRFLSEERSHGTVQASLNGRLRLIGRVRLDGRDELRSAISSSDRLLDESDGRLCLHAYAKWGDRCAEFLKGDFCFVLWDEDRQRLFCARDHFGVRPLFYTRTKNEWLISDSLQTIAASSNLASELDNHWIADFLTVGYCLDPDRTIYKVIKRLSPAHIVLISHEQCVVRRYWTLDIKNPVYYRNPNDYLTRFRELLSSAIRDRLPPERVGISMSGGLDSSTLAAQTVKVRGHPSKVVAHTCYFEHLIPDEERRFSEQVAHKLEIELITRAVDESFYDPQWHIRDTKTPEPSQAIVRAHPQDIIDQERAELSAVWFFGEGPDNALQFEWRSYLRWLLTEKSWRHLGEAIIQYILSKQGREWYTTVRNRMFRQSAEVDSETDVSEWLADSLVKEVDVVARLEQWNKSRVGEHPWHPRAIASFNSAIWPNFLESFDPAMSKTRVDWRHPFLDLRVVDFLLSVPPIPWARRKRLIREAMRDTLPEEVIDRDKAPLARDPEAILLRQYPLPRCLGTAFAAPWVNTERLCTVKRIEEHQLMKIHALEFWLRKRN